MAVEGFHALSRREHGFESRRERHINNKLAESHVGLGDLRNIYVIRNGVWRACVSVEVAVAAYSPPDRPALVHARNPPAGQSDAVSSRIDYLLYAVALQT